MARKRQKERQERGYKNKSWICKGARVVFHGSKNGFERVICKRKERKAAKAKKEEGWVSLVLSFLSILFHRIINMDRFYMLQPLLLKTFYTTE